MFAIELVEQLNFRCPRFCEIWHVSKGSIDCNAGQPYLGWDTDEFPSDPRTQGRYPIQGWYGVDQRLEEADGNAKPTYVESTKHGLVTSTCTMQPVSTSYQPLINLLQPVLRVHCQLQTIHAIQLQWKQTQWKQVSGIGIWSWHCYNAVLSLLSLKEVLTLDAHRGGTGRHRTWGKQLRLQAQKREHWHRGRSSSNSPLAKCVL